MKNKHQQRQKDVTFKQMRESIMQKQIEIKKHRQSLRLLKEQAPDVPRKEMKKIQKKIRELKIEIQATLRLRENQKINQIKEIQATLRLRENQKINQTKEIIKESMEKVEIKKTKTKQKPQKPPNQMRKTQTKPQQKTQTKTKEKTQTKTADATEKNETTENGKNGLNNCKVMIAEKMLCHYECMPTWAYLFNELGAQVYISQSRSGNNQNMIPLMKKWINKKLRVLKSFSAQNFDIVVNNSLYPHHKVQNINSKRRTYSVLHRFGKFNDHKVVNHPKHWIISLAPHVHEKVKALTPRSICLMPIYFGPVKNIKVSEYGTETNPVKFIIQGNIEFKRRNYKSIFTIAQQCIAKGHKNFRIIIMGRGNKRKINGWITPELKGKIQIINGAGYERYFNEIRGCHWLLPLIDGTYKHQYFTHKLSSSMSMGIGNKVPLILHTKLCKIYELKSDVNSLEYVSMDQFRDQVIKALTMTNRRYQKYRDEMNKVYDGWMKKNKTSLSKIMN